VRRAILILVSDRRAIVERGTHEELMSNQGLYSQMVSYQTEAEARRHVDEFLSHNLDMRRLQQQAPGPVSEVGERLHFPFRDRALTLSPDKIEPS
jgi:hypothetical protein